MCFQLLSLWMKSYSVRTIKMKATEQYFPVVLLIIMLCTRLCNSF